MIAAGDAEVAAALGAGRAAHGVGVEGVDPHGDRGVEFVARQRPPGGGRGGELVVELGPHRIVDDQGAQPHDARDHPLADLPGQEAGVEAGQVVAQDDRGVHQRQGAAVGDGQRASDLGGGLIDRVAGPPRPRRISLSGGLGAAASFGQRGQQSGLGGGRGSGPARDGVDQFAIRGVGQRGRTRKRTVEHVFYFRAAR
ncbi:hypothetical protein MPOR_10710 [Mycolicibacterium poriferae]|uniref:Uncharacterized protein n=1 Tax=Mycolicibacterium poriferae TaxID=39694 RepID=A0A6N4V577_9MYCO|nr:hypothetical protein [Mycolicibacterium poriferae]BBX50045.1 hypothetical protein MPOR_10710 [Mycolicibacterium poriferae]